MTDSPAPAPQTVIDVADWRRRVFALYDDVRQAAGHDPHRAHEIWVAGRDRLLATHPATAIPEPARDTFAGVPVHPYDPQWRFALPITPAPVPQRLDVPTGTDGVVPFELLGTVDVPDVGSLDVWRLASYGGGLFLPIKDALAGAPGGTYGGGRYLLDTIKGAWLGTDGPNVVLDFNFAYNPSCAYDGSWACPLAPPGNTVQVPIPVGERLAE